MIIFIKNTIFISDSFTSKKEILGWIDRHSPTLIIYLTNEINRGVTVPSNLNGNTPLNVCNTSFSTFLHLNLYFQIWMNTVKLINPNSTSLQKSSDTSFLVIKGYMLMKCYFKTLFFFRMRLIHGLTLLPWNLASKANTTRPC